MHDSSGHGTFPKKKVGMALQACVCSILRIKESHVCAKPSREIIKWRLKNKYKDCNKPKSGYPYKLSTISVMWCYTNFLSDQLVFKKSNTGTTIKANVHQIQILAAGALTIVMCPN